MWRELILLLGAGCLMAIGCAMFAAGFYLAIAAGFNLAERIW
jgi:hypothetical protein